MTDKPMGKRARRQLDKPADAIESLMADIIASVENPVHRRSLFMWSLRPLALFREGRFEDVRALLEEQRRRKTQGEPEGGLQ